MLDHLPSRSEAGALYNDDRVLWCREVEHLDNKAPGAIPTRVQEIRALRGDQLVTFRQVIGPFGLYPGPAFQFYAGWEYSVGEVMEIMERQRHGKPPEADERPDLRLEYLKALDERQSLRAHRTVAGPAITIQRD